MTLIEVGWGSPEDRQIFWGKKLIIRRREKK